MLEGIDEYRDKGTERKQQGWYRLAIKQANQGEVPEEDMIITGSEQSIFLHSAEQSEIRGNQRGRRGERTRGME